MPVKKEAHNESAEGASAAPDIDVAVVFHELEQTAA